jgi:hypothetical protein
VNGSGLLYGLQLKNYETIYDEIRPEAFLKKLIIVHDWNGNLSHHPQSPFLQFVF